MPSAAGQEKLTKILIPEIQKELCWVQMRCSLVLLLLLLQWMTTSARLLVCEGSLVCLGGDVEGVKAM
jgi:hypothetical protein